MISKQENGRRQWGVGVTIEKLSDQIKNCKLIVRSEKKLIVMLELIANHKRDVIIKFN